MGELTRMCSYSRHILFVLTVGLALCDLARATTLPEKDPWGLWTFSAGGQVGAFLTLVAEAVVTPLPWLGLHASLSSLFMYNEISGGVRIIPWTSDRWRLFLASRGHGFIYTMGFAQGGGSRVSAGTGFDIRMGERNVLTLELGAWRMLSVTDSMPSPSNGDAGRVIVGPYFSATYGFMTR